MSQQDKVGAMIEMEKRYPMEGTLATCPKCSGWSMILKRALFYHLIPLLGMKTHGIRQ